MKMLLTLYDVAEMAGITYQTARGAVIDGRIAAFKIGNRWKVKKEDAERFVLNLAPPADRPNSDFIDMFLKSGEVKVGEYSDRFVVYWNDGGDVYVCSWPDETDAGHHLGFKCSGFDTWLHIRRASPIERSRHAARLFDEIICSGCDPIRTSREFMKIPEFRDYVQSFSKALTKLASNH